MKTSIYTKIRSFLFEIFIVTIGILAAFSINKWDENRKLAKEEQESYKALVKDLQSDLVVFNHYKPSFIQGNKYLTPILNNHYNQIDSLELYIQLSFDLQEGGATYNALKFGGKLDLLKNSKVKQLLILYYETYYQGLEKMSKMNYDFTFNSIKPYLIKHLKYQYNSEDLKLLLQQDEFLNLIKAQNDILTYNVSTITKSEHLINKLLEELNKELENRQN